MAGLLRTIGKLGCGYSKVEIVAAADLRLNRAQRFASRAYAS